MRTVFFLIAFFAGTIQLSGQQIFFSIKGTIDSNSKASKIFLQAPNVNIEIPITEKRDFVYSSSIPEPNIFLIKTDNSYAQGVWISGGDIDIHLQEEVNSRDSLGKRFLVVTSIKGPEQTEKYQWFVDERNNLSVSLHLKPSQFEDSMKKYFDPLLEEYITSHPQSEFSTFITGLASDKEQKLRLLALLDNPSTKELAQRTENALLREKSTRPGTTIENFQISDIKGNTFSLDGLTAEYILLDFWSWDCVPCRHQHPALRKMYSAFHSKGFEVVSISLDYSKKEWEKAVDQDKLPWIQVSELKGWESQIAKKYFMESVPFNILIDKNKKIVATNLSMSDLEEKLNEVFN